MRIDNNKSSYVVYWLCDVMCVTMKRGFQLISFVVGCFFLGVPEK